MTLSTWFWVIYVITLLFGGYFGYNSGQKYWWNGWVVNAILFFIVGLEVFGSPIKGH